MIVSQGISQITYIIKDKKYICYTPEENRKFALLIYNDKSNKLLIQNYYLQISTYKSLVKAYKQDSIIYINYADNAAKSLAICKTVNRDQNTAIIALQTKVEKRNKWIWGLGILSGITTGVLTYTLIHK